MQVLWRPRLNFYLPLKSLVDVISSVISQWDEPVTLDDSGQLEFAHLEARVSLRLTLKVNIFNSSEPQKVILSFGCGMISASILGNIDQLGDFRRLGITGQLLELHVIRAILAATVLTESSGRRLARTAIGLLHYIFDR